MEHPKTTMVIWLILWIVSFCLLVSVDGHCGESDGIKYLVRKAPNHPMQSDAKRDEMAGYIREAALEYGHDVWLILAMVYCESSFNTKARGKLKEIGLLQIMPMHKKTCRKRGYDLGTGKGQIFCGAYLLSRANKTCGNAYLGLSMYASGSCKPRTYRTRYVLNRRFKIAAKLKLRFGGVE